MPDQERARAFILRREGCPDADVTASVDAERAALRVAEAERDDLRAALRTCHDALQTEAHEYGWEDAPLHVHEAITAAQQATNAYKETHDA